MGDITGRPKAPSQQVVYVPQYVYPETGSGGSSDVGSGTKSNTGETPDAPTQAEQREKNLLGRSRSRIGTILTGFRGILAPNSHTDSTRKTLLGE